MEHQRHDQTILRVEPKPAETMVIESSPVQLVPGALCRAGAQRGLRNRPLKRHLPANEIRRQLASRGDNL